VFRFVERERASYPVRILCRVLGVSPSGFYAWRARPPSGRALADAQLTVTIRQIHADSRGCYGAPRVHAELHQAHGLRCGRKRVERLMRQAQLQGVCRGQHGRPRTTRREPSHAVTADLVHRHFRASGPDQLWVADITYLPTWQGFLYLAVVLDAFSRKIVGWSMANHLRTELVLGALDMALWNRRPHPGLIHHADHGSQYTSLAFGARCREAGIRLSMGSVGDAYDNALCESFFGSLEAELIDRCTWRTHHEARLAVFSYLEMVYNRARRHSALGYVSPTEFERRYAAPAEPLAS
jgi:putative transposase